jgi:hypothetical protein
MAGLDFTERCGKRLTDIRSCPEWGTATERWRRNGACFETKVSEDVISASAEVNKDFSTVNDLTAA